MFLNPIGFALCEVQKWRQASQPQRSTLGILGVVVLQVLKNPIVFMVVVGIVSHFALSQRIPAVLSEFIDGLANSFGGAALFYLGLTMVGQLTKLTRDTGVALILLITAKLLVMPLVCKDMVDILDMGVNSSSSNHTSLSNFAFLYGVFPTAPSVAIYAAQYNMELEVVTSGMVISTFLSAPIMYVSAWLLTIPLMDPTPLVTELQNVSFNISIVSLIALVWTIAVMLLSRKFNRLPHLFALNLFLAQFLVCVSMILWNFVVKQDNLPVKVLTFTLLYGSLYSTYIWTGLIPLCLALTNRDDLLRLRPGVFMLLGWGVPFLMVGGLLVAGDRMNDSIDSAFFYGRAQIISTAVVLAVSLLLGAISLMGLSQGGREQRDYQALDRASVTGITEDPRTPGGLEDQQQQQQQQQTGSPSDCSLNSDLHSCSPLQSIPDMIASTQREHTHTTGHSGALCDVQHQSSTSPEQPLNLPPPGLQTHDEKQTVRHVLLCLLLIVSLLANLSSCLWWLFNRDPGRLYLELQFFCAVANYGQGFISFGIFGLDRHLLNLPFKKRLLGLWQGRDGEELSPSVVPEEVRLTCTQFVRYHKDQCVQDIVHTRRCDGGEGVGGEGEGEGGGGGEESGFARQGQNQYSHPHQPWDVPQRQALAVGHEQGQHRVQTQHLQEQIPHEPVNQHEVHQSHNPVRCQGQRCPPPLPNVQPGHECQAQSLVTNPNLPAGKALQSFSSNQLQPDQARSYKSHPTTWQTHDNTNPCPLNQSGDRQAHGCALNSTHPHSRSHLEGLFRGSDLVDWLVQRGLCVDRVEAQFYGGRLQQGGVLHHMAHRKSFKDDPVLLYCFTQGKGTVVGGEDRRERGRRWWSRNL
ncbi:lysosomal cholesterol signaling protein isoform 2-T2 [Polymixia lowei]